jgi:DNA-binding NarL/FixJ family response regulator
MEKIRVLLANRPRIMREVVRNIIEHQPDMEIVGKVLDPLEVLFIAKEKQVDAVVVAFGDSEESGLSSHLFTECPNVRIVGLVSSSNAAFIEQLCPWRKEIMDPSVDHVLGALRHAVQDPCSAEDNEET